MTNSNFDLLKANLQNIAESISEEVYERIPSMGNRDLTELLNATVNSLEKLQKMEKTDQIQITEMVKPRAGVTLGLKDPSKMSNLLSGS